MNFSNLLIIFSLMASYCHPAKAIDNPEKPSFDYSQFSGHFTLFECDGIPVNISVGPRPEENHITLQIDPDKTFSVIGIADYPEGVAPSPNYTRQNLFKFMDINKGEYSLWGEFISDCAPNPKSIKSNFFEQAFDEGTFETYQTTGSGHSLKTIKSIYGHPGLLEEWRCELTKSHDFLKPIERYMFEVNVNGNILTTIDSIVIDLWKPLDSPVVHMCHWKKDSSK